MLKPFHLIASTFHLIALIFHLIALTFHLIVLTFHLIALTFHFIFLIHFTLFSRIIFALLIFVEINSVVDDSFPEKKKNVENEILFVWVELDCQWSFSLPDKVFVVFSIALRKDKVYVAHHHTGRNLKIPSAVSAVCDRAIIRAHLQFYIIRCRISFELTQLILLFLTLGKWLQDLRGLL